jgi:4-aminobutyrate aminotransferase
MVAKKPPVPGPLAQKFVARDVEAISPSYTRSYPFVMDHGLGTTVWDVDSTRFVDFTSGIATTSTGHTHPEVVKAIQDQAARFIHMSGTDFYYRVQIELAEKINALVPGNVPKQTFFTNSGTESIEAALKLARYATQRSYFIAFLGAFHGRSMGALSLGASKYVHRRGFAPVVPNVTHVPYGYCYRCAFNLQYPACDVQCVKYIEDTIFARLVPHDEVAAIFVEPIQGEGGYVIPPPLYHQRLRELADRHGILLAVDEIQTGIGRTGKMFAIEHWGVTPDITCIAKGIASGMPLGAMVAKKKWMVWPSGAHANTFGGNPVSCAAALATLRLVEGGFMLNAARMGEVFLEKLRGLQGKHKSIGDVRGLGLMLGVELVKDKQTKVMAPQLRDAVVQKCFEKGLLVLGCGMNVVRLVPALNVTVDAMEEGLSIFQQALAEAEAEV